MAIDTTASLLDALREHRLVEPEQYERLALALNRPDPPPLPAILRRLVAEGWLTQYQADKLAAGKPEELVLGPYRLLQTLGEGGMGQVYKARDKLSRTVALKVIRPQQIAQASAVERFLREIQLAAQLSHPHVVRAFDADQVDGAICFAMEFVEGADLAHVVQERGPLPVPSALEYARQAALGLQYAHEKGLVHRDVKPSNLMLLRPAGTNKSGPMAATGKSGPMAATGSSGPMAATPRSGAAANPLGHVKLLDLGLARLQAEGDNFAALTAAGMVMGTPDYIAPEQARNSSLADARSDLYSLGCTLYFLLTGQPPFPGGTSPLEKALQHQMDPAPLLTAYRKEIPGGVVALVRKLLAKRPENRFQTAAELVAVLEQFGRGDYTVTFAVDMQGEPTVAGSKSARAKLLAPLQEQAAAPRPAAETATSARTPSRPFRATGTKPKPAARGRWVSAFAAVVALLIIGGAGWAWWVLAPGPVTVTVAANQTWQDTGLDFNPEVSPTLRVRVVGGEWQLGPDFPACGALGLADRHRELAVRSDANAMCLLVRVGSGPPESLLNTNVELRPTAAGRVFVQANALDLSAATGALTVAIDGSRRGTGPGTADLLPAQLRFNRAQQAWPALAARGQDLPADADDLKKFAGDLRIFLKTHAGAPQALPAAKLLGRVLARVPSALDGLTLPADARAPGAPPELIAVLGSPAWRTWRPALPLTCCAAGPDGRLAATGGEDGAVLVWEAATGKFLFTLEAKGKRALALAFSPDGQLLAVAGGDGTVGLWDLTTRETVATLQGPTEGVTALAFAPGGKVLATAGADKAVRLWDVDRAAAAFGKEQGRLEGPAAAVTALAFAADGKTLAAADQEVVRLWDLGSKAAKNAWNLPAAAVGLAFTADGQLLTAAGSAVDLRDPATGQSARRLAELDAPAAAWAVAPKGTAAMVGTTTGAVVFVDAAGGPKRAVKGAHLGPVTGLAFVGDGAALSVGGDAAVRSWDVAAGQERAATGHHGAMTSLAFAPDGEGLVSGGQDGAVRLWDLRRGRERQVLTGHTKAVTDVAFEPDGKWVASASADTSIRIWTVGEAKSKHVLNGHEAAVTRVVIAPNGQTVAAGGVGGRVTLWDPEAGQQRAATAGLRAQEEVTGLAFSPDSATLAAVAKDRQLHLFILNQLLGQGRGFAGRPGGGGGFGGAGFGGAGFGGGRPNPGADVPPPPGAQQGGPEGIPPQGAPGGGRVRPGGGAGGIGRGQRGGLAGTLGQGANAGISLAVGGAGLAFAPDGRTVAVGGVQTDQAVRVFDVLSGSQTPVATWTGPADTVTAVAFAPDGYTVLTGGQAGWLIWWDVATGQRKGTWQLPGAVHGVAFAPDGRHVATANANGTAWVLRLTAPQEKP